MALSLKNAKLVSSLIVDGFSNAIISRAFSSATQGVASTTKKLGRVASLSGKMVKKSGDEAGVNVEKASWIPDPKTGYYKPENIKVMDPAELRALLLTNKYNKNN